MPLAPDDCESVICGYVRFPELYQNPDGKKYWYLNYSAAVSLTDCHRQIQWNLLDHDEDSFNIAKLDTAIRALNTLRDYLVKASVELDECKKKKKEWNSAIDNGEV